MGLQHGPTVAFFLETGIYSGLKHQGPISGFWMLPSQRQNLLRETGLIKLSPDAAAEKGFTSPAAQALPVASMPNSNSIARDCAAGICPKQNT
jgi:sulfur relay (sulfurtransferase) complex TusBCD TusD component (DsrE family)